jgi:hypothetical protein
MLLSILHSPGRTDGPVLSLCNPILLRIVQDSQLPLGPCLLAKILEVIGGVLSPIIRPQDLGPLPYLVLYLGLELPKSIKDLILGLNKEDTGFPSKSSFHDRKLDAPSNLSSNLRLVVAIFQI